MLSKCLEAKLELIPEENWMESKKDHIELEYYMVESKNDEDEELRGRRLYGVEIVKKIGTHSIEKELVRNLSCCEDSAREIIDKLAKNTVTPVGLPFVIEDLLGA
ncbi:MAG: DUF6514 family protein [Clostridia bacterium]|nr:DUF6514 family protein [Clostridia bacterium]